MQYLGYLGFPLTVDALWFLAYPIRRVDDFVAILALGLSVHDAIISPPVKRDYDRFSHCWVQKVIAKAKKRAKSDRAPWWDVFG